MIKKKYILAHDTGTGGNKAVLTDLRGKIVHSVYREYGRIYPKKGWVEQDPNELWRAVAETSKQVVREGRILPGEILGVGISAQMFNLLPVDAKGHPLINMISWLDVRSISQAEYVMREEIRQLLYAQTGNIPTAKDIIPKILWFKASQPELFQRTYKLLDCKEYIIHKLTGEFAIDWHGASAFFLFDPYEKKWSQAACDCLGIPVEMLPDPVPCTSIVGNVTQEAARQTGLIQGTPVVICAGDVAVAQTGSGSNKAGRAHLCVGTAAWVGISSTTFVNSEKKPLWALNHIDPEKWIIAGEMETGGGALMWFKEVFCELETAKAKKKGTSAYTLLGQMAKEVKPGSNGLLFAPWLSGERSPVLNHYARGAWVGISLSHTKAHFTRAVLEGVAYQLRWICEALEKQNLQFDEVNAVGGGCTSPLWSQIISDVTNKTLHIVKNPLNGGAVGAALTVAVGLGVYPNLESLDKLIEIETTITPNPAYTNYYSDLYEEYRQMYKKLKRINQRLYELS